MADKVGPISPTEISKTKKRIFPEAVFESFNELIAQKFTAGRAVVKQKDVVSLMVEKGLNREEIFSNGWLNIEEVYHEAGWIVVFDKPGYNETYEASFEFRIPRTV